MTVGDTETEAWKNRMSGCRVIMGEAVAYELEAVEKSPLRAWKDLQWRTTEKHHQLKES